MKNLFIKSFTDNKKIIEISRPNEAFDKKLIEFEK